MSGSYFSHDANARNSEELMAVRMKHGAAGYGVYFMLIERLRESDDYTSAKDYNLIAFDLRVDTALIKSVIEDFGLFAFTEDGKCFYSEGLMKRMKHKDAVSEARAKAGKIGAANRWQTPSDDAHNAENSKTIANAIEENGKTMAIKEKKSKVKEIKEKERVGKDTPAPTHDKLPEGTFIPTTVLFEQMTADAAWLERVAKNTKSTVDAIRKELSEFCEGLMLTEDAKELTDARRHFISWRRKRQQVTGNPVAGGRPYRMLTYEQMLNEMGKNGTTMAAYTKVVVSGKEKPLWVTKADKQTYNIPDAI